MCGIAGRWNFRTGAPVHTEHLLRMNGCLAHRGPDDAGVFAQGDVGLAQTRLAVIDLSPAGHQPMHSQDGQVTLVFNGEIYNFLILRRDLERQGYRFRSSSDTEVILALWQHHGPKCLKFMRGMFALAIWDQRRRQLFAARDRLGKKPFYYRVDRDGFEFASEPKAFFADPGFQATPNVESLAQYLTWQYVPSPACAFQGVSKLPAAHYLVVDRNGVTVERYWQLAYEPKYEVSLDEAKEGVLARLTEAVDLRMISDVPLGAFLSGGIDSSLVAALMARTGARVKTFTVGFEGADCDEAEHARLVAQALATEHHEIQMRPEALEALPLLSKTFDEPFADPAAIPTLYLAEFARRHVTVALNGDGGDEGFAGYKRYLPLRRRRAERLLRTLVPSRLHRLVSSSLAALEFTDSGGRAAGLVSRSMLTEQEHYARRMMILGPATQRRVFAGELKRLCNPMDMSALVVAQFAASGAVDPVDQLLDVDMAHYLPDCLLPKVDMTTMAHALESRSPLLDHELLEYAARLPSRFKLRNGRTKVLLREIAADLLPASLVERPKQGFSVPLAQWFRDELRGFAHDLLFDGRMLQRGYFNGKALRSLWNQHQRGRSSRANELWTLVMLEMWHRAFIDRRPHAYPLPRS